MLIDGVPAAPFSLPIHCCGTRRSFPLTGPSRLARPARANPLLSSPGQRCCFASRQDYVAELRGRSGRRGS
ncbi:hypothetical protein B296_00049950 [Ensete ventricosum]|uniref:Uncharacterized protein n=1 Tax=Ensete ventricosum TaxID=4639 RepID=A0A426X3F9_ENSVE|nr:hypothetical protein B296_00049950 [Ensete ventricosum]